MLQTLVASRFLRESHDVKRIHTFTNYALIVDTSFTYVIVSNSTYVNHLYFIYADTGPERHFFNWPKHQQANPALGCKPIELSPFVQGVSPDDDIDFQAAYTFLQGLGPQAGRGKLLHTLVIRNLTEIPIGMILQYV